MPRVRFPLLAFILPGVFLVGPVSGQDKKPTPGNLLAASLRAQEQGYELARQRKAAVGHRAISINYLQAIKLELTHAESDAKRIKIAKQHVDKYAGLMASPGRSPRHAKGLEWSERLLTAAWLTDPGERESELAMAEAEFERVRKEAREIASPFDARLRSLQAEFKPMNTPMVQLIKSHLKTPTGTFAGDVDPSSVWAEWDLSPVNATWKDADGNKLAQASFHIQDPAVMPGGAKRNLLDDKFPIQSSSDRSMIVWAGYVTVIFTARRDDLRDEDELKRQIQNFIDLEGLAKYEPVRDDAE
jgi:hypothetical protein